jgi:hypothetical protein
MAAAGVQPEYLTVVDPDSLARVERIDGRVLVVVAARVGPARLIDNILIEQVATRRAGVNPAKETRCPPRPARTTPTTSRAGR